MQSLPAWVSVAAVPLGFVVVWCVVVALVSLLGGWWQLGRRYASARPLPGRVTRFESATLRWLVGYNAMLTVGVDEGGVHLAVFWPFRFLHPPLYLPWEAIEVTPYQRLFARGAEIRARDVPGVPVRLFHDGGALVLSSRPPVEEPRPPAPAPGPPPPRPSRGATPRRRR